MNASVFSLYRSYLRQVRELPHFYLRLFFRIKAADDFQALLKTDIGSTVRTSRFKRVSKDLRKIEEANRGNHKAFAHVLDLAYGRKGKLFWEIMEPLLSDPKAPLPPRLIPSEEKSHPPVYSPELKSLLTSGISRTSKALSPPDLKMPPLLPARADPSSDDARLLGPLSKRRELNIRWRYFQQEWKKVRPPIEVTVLSAETGQVGRSQQDILRAGIREVGFQGLGLFEEVENLVGSPSPPLTKRERQTTGDAITTSNPSSTRLPSRWLRRRYAALLARLPIMTHVPSHQPDGKGSYVVSLSPKARSINQSREIELCAEVDDNDLAWIDQGRKEAAELQQKPPKKHNSKDNK